MNTFDKWFTRFMYSTEIIFLLASVPHIATWFAHFDNPTDWTSTVYAYSIGLALAIAIDGVAFMVLLAIQRMLKSGEKKNGFVLTGLLVFMVAIACLSWFINWQYDVQFASNSFDRASAAMIGPVSVGTLNPIIGGCFQVLILAYALISKAVAVEVKPAMTEAQYQAEKLRLQREKELKALRKPEDSAGLLSAGKERLLGKGKDEKEIREERLTVSIDFLRTAQELLSIDEEPRAIAALTSLLNLKEKQVLPYLIAARSTIVREQAAAQESDNQADRNTDKMEALTDLFTDNQADESADTSPDTEMSGNRLRGPVYILLDDAVESTGYSKEYLQKLVRTGALLTKKGDKNKLLVSSLNAYTSSHKRTGDTGVMPAISRTETGRSNVLEFAQKTETTEQANRLGMIENAMLQAIQKATADEQAELRLLASEKPLHEFTSILQSRYPQYANYITESRVARVMKAMNIEQQEPELTPVG